MRKIYAVLLLCAGIWFECAAQCGNVGAITGPAQVCVGSGITLAYTSAEGTWRSSNAAIATVNTSGMVTGVAVGSDSIIYTNVCGTDSVAYFIMVNALPVINPVANQTVCTGNATNEVTFSGTPLTVYNWTNSNPAIGLATSGTGGVPSFISINAGTTPVVATITATPVESEGFAYIANSGADSVSVINTNTNTVVASVIVGYAPGGIAVNPAGSYAYVANYDVASVSVVSQVTHTVTATINTGGAPVGIAVSPDGSKVYTGNADNGHVWVINTATNTVTDSVRVGAYPASIVVSPDGNKVYAVINSSGTNGAVAVVNTATNTLIDTIAVGSYPSGIAASADGTRVYVTNYGSNSVSAISTANDSVIATILSPLIKLPGGIAVSPDGSKVYVVSIDINAIAVINTTTNIVIDTIAVGDNPEGVALTYDGSFAYVSNYYSNNTSVINTATHAVINTVPVGKHPGTVGNYVSSGDGCTGEPITFTITVNPSSTMDPVPNQTVCTGNTSNPVTFTGPPLTVYSWTNNNPAIGLAASGTGNLPSFTAINTGTMPVTATITATPAQSGAVAYITNTGYNSISAINLVTDSVITTINAGYYVYNSLAPIGVATSTDGNRVYITNSGVGDSSVSVISTATNTIIDTINVDGFEPFGIAISPDGSKLYVSTTANTVSVINTATNRVVTSFYVNQQPTGIAVSPDGSKVYVANTNVNTLSVISAVIDTVIATINTGMWPLGVAVSPDGSRVYVTIYDSNYVSVINTATNQVIANITTGNAPYEVALSPDGSKAYVSNGGSNDVSVINTATNLVIDGIGGLSIPQGLSVSKDGSQLYVAESFTDDMAVISTATNTLTDRIPVSVGPAAFGNFIANGSGCTGVPVTFTITINPVLYDSINRSICQGDSFYLDNRTYTLPGDYTDTLTNISGCDSVITLKLTVNRLPVVSFSLEPLYQENDLSFYGGIVWCEDNVNPSNFALTGGGPVGGYYAGNTVHNDTFYAQFSSSLADTVTYYYTDTNNCANSAYSIIKDVICEGITTIPAANLFTLYPNPADDYVMIDFDAAHTSSTVFIKDITGRQLFETQLTTGPQQIPTGNLPPGVYLVTLYKNGQLGARLMVKE